MQFDSVLSTLRTVLRRPYESVLKYIRILLNAASEFVLLHVVEYIVFTRVRCNKSVANCIVDEGR